MDEQALLLQIQDKINALTCRDTTLNGDEEVYYDLRVSGLDLFDLVTWLGQKFDVDFREMRINEYAPGEGAEILRPLLELLGLRPYQSLRVRDLICAVKEGRWSSSSKP